MTIDRGKHPNKEGQVSFRLCNQMTQAFRERVSDAVLVDHAVQAWSIKQNILACSRFWVDRSEGDLD